LTPKYIVSKTRPKINNEIIELKISSISKKLL